MINTYSTYDFTAGYTAGDDTAGGGGWVMRLLLLAKRDIIALPRTLRRSDKPSALLLVGETETNQKHRSVCVCVGGG
jgi:hypothetical protein